LQVSFRLLALISIKIGLVLSTISIANFGTQGKNDDGKERPTEVNYNKYIFNKVQFKCQVISRQQLIAAVVKKRAAIARAHEIVVRLLEPGIPEPEFLSLVKQCKFKASCAA